MSPIIFSTLKKIKGKENWAEGGAAGIGIYVGHSEAAF